jgi:isoleucyl-tRNA synthetase
MTTGRAVLVAFAIVCLFIVIYSVFKTDEPDVPIHVKIATEDAVEKVKEADVAVKKTNDAIRVLEKVRVEETAKEKTVQNLKQKLDKALDEQEVAKKVVKQSAAVVKEAVKVEKQVSSVAKASVDKAVAVSSDAGVKPSKRMITCSKGLSPERRKELEAGRYSRAAYAVSGNKCWTGGATYNKGTIATKRQVRKRALRVCENNRKQGVARLLKTGVHTPPGDKCRIVYSR